MFKTVIFCGLIATAMCSFLPELATNEEIYAKFQDFVQEYGKQYDHHDMEFYRFRVFKDNYLKIQEHNQKESTYELGITQFADWTWEEFQKYYKLDQTVKAAQHCSATQGPMTELKSSLPSSVDWRTKGVLTPVKNQGECGSCWTFSTTGAMEAHWSIDTGKTPVSLAEQQLVDCAYAFNNNGCDGGLPSQAFEYIRYNGGLEPEADYPYLAKDGTGCHFDASKVAATTTGSHNITLGDENGLQEAVAEDGPVSIAFEVVDDFMHYKSGVYQSSTCGNKPSDVNHAVLVVGYGTESDSPYWIVKNSWGGSWGEDGYFKILRGNNMCGLADCASYPLNVQPPQ